MIVATVVSVLALIGALTVVVLGLGLAYYVVTRRPTPDATVREALTSVSWRHGIGLFVLPPALAGAQDGPETAVAGAVLGLAFVLFLVGLQWWWGPI